MSSVYEAASHQRWAQYSYLVIESLDKDVEFPDNISTECSRFGVGLMKAYPVLKSPDYEVEEVLEATRANPEPKELDRMLRDFFKDDEKGEKRFKDAIGR